MTFETVAAALVASQMASMAEAQRQYSEAFSARRGAGQESANRLQGLLSTPRRISHNCINCGAPGEAVCSYCGAGKT